MTENSRLLLTDKLLPSSKVQLWLQSSSVISIQTHIETEDIKIFACQRNSCQIMDNSFLNADSLAGPELVPWPTTATGNYAVLWLPTISTTGTGAEISLLRSVSLILFTFLLVRLIKRTILGFSVLFELLLVLYHIVSWYTVIFNSKLLVCVFFYSGKTFHPAAHLSSVVSSVSGASRKNSSFSAVSPLTIQVCNESRRVKCSSLAKHRRSHSHSYDNHISKRSTIPAVSSEKLSKLRELLQCHTHSLYKRRTFPQRPVVQDILVADTDPSEEPLFASCSHMQRSTPADVERIFGKTALSSSEDDQTDVAYTADDMKSFNERKMLAKELDTMIGDVIVID